MTEPAPDRKHTILDAACRVIAQAGAARLRVADVAREAGVSTALVHYYFPSRADVIEQAFAHADDLADAVADAKLQAIGTGRGRVEKLFATWAGDDPAIRANWAVWNEMWQYAAHNDGARALVETSHRRWLEQIHDLIAEGVDGRLDPGRRRPVAGGAEAGRLRQRVGPRGAARPADGTRPAPRPRRDGGPRARPGQGRKGEGGVSAEPLRTLPAWVYRTPEFYRAERRAIWSREWLLVGHISQLKEPGDYVSMRIAGEPIAVVKGADGELRGFSNVCRHRAARILDGAGNCGKAIRCPYHGWTYGLDGRLLAVPEKTGFPGFDRDENGLWPRARRRRRWVRLREPLGRARADRDRARPVLGVARALSPRAARELPNGIVRASHQLEELDRQLPRGLPRAGRPPGPLAAARLQELPGRDDRRQRLDRPQPDARQAVARPPRAALPAPRAADARPARARVRAVELRVRVPGHDGQPLPRPDRLLAQLPARRAAHAHDLERVSAARDLRAPRPAGTASSTPASTTSCRRRTTS